MSRDGLTVCLAPCSGTRVTVSAGPLEQREQAQPIGEIVLVAAFVAQPAGDQPAVRLGLEAKREAIGRHGDEFFAAPCAQRETSVIPVRADIGLRSDRSTIGRSKEGEAMPRYLIERL